MDESRGIHRFHTKVLKTIPATGFSTGMIHPDTGEILDTVSNLSLLTLFSHTKEFSTIIHTLIKKKNKFKSSSAPSAI